MPLSVENDNEEQLKEAGYSVTNLGASANTLITLAGERKGFVGSNGFIWDFAPPALMLIEAGWVVTDFHGNPFLFTGKIENRYPGVIAAETDFHPKLLHALNPPAPHLF